jgi:glycosyltransferase involved in cell wall biosynthesis
MDDRKVTAGASLRHRILDSGGFDPSRFRFVGWLPEDKLVDLLSISDLHVYLTVPFITSWSMLDAMSCGCVVLASDQACTREYITHGRNGLLCDFFDAEGIAKQAIEVLKDPAAYRVLGHAARITVEEEYSLDVCLPRIRKFFEDVVAKGPRTPSVRCEELVHTHRHPACVS